MRIFIVSFLVFVLWLQYAGAFTSPAGNPPSQPGISLPLREDNSIQTKTGDLWVNSLGATSRIEIKATGLDLNQRTEASITTPLSGYRIFFAQGSNILKARRTDGTVEEVGGTFPFVESPSGRWYKLPGAIAP